MTYVHGTTYPQIHKPGWYQQSGWDGPDRLRRLVVREGRASAAKRTAAICVKDV